MDRKPRDPTPEELAARQKWLEEEVAKEEAEKKRKFEERWRRPSESFHRPITPEELAELKAIADRAIAQMAATACKGDRANLPLCTEEVEKACPKRGFNSCPRRIIEHENRIARPRDAADQSTFQSMLRHGIPKPMAQILASGKERKTKCIEAASAWFREDPRPRVLVLAGDPGIGKSMAAASIVARFGGLFVPVAKFCTKIFDDDYQTALRLPAILVLDDLGTEALGEDERNKSSIASLICNRVDTGLFTVLPLMIEVNQLRPRYGDAVADRIKRLGRVRVIEDVSQRSLADWKNVDHGEPEEDDDDEP